MTERDLAGGDLADVAAKAMPSSSMKGNPVMLTEAELMEVVRRAL